MIWGAFWYRSAYRCMNFTECSWWRWEGIRAFLFNIWGTIYAGPDLDEQPVDMRLSDFRFRQNDGCLATRRT